MVKLSSLSCYNVSMLAFPAQYAMRVSCMYPNYGHFGVRCKKMNLNTRKSSWAHRDKSDYCTRLYDNEVSWTIPFPGCGCKKIRENGEGNVFVVQSQNSSRGDRNEDRRGSRNRRFALRLRPRMRLLSSKLRRMSSFHQIREMVGKNFKVVILSFVATTIFSLCYVFLRMTSAPSPKVVPYSDLIMDLQAGYVTKVLFEEGSRRIFFNIKKEPKQDLASSIVVNTVTDEFVQCSTSSSDAKEVGEEERTSEVDSFAAGSEGVLPKIRRWRLIPRSKVTSPQWQLSTRKIDHDENFLLGLMREKGITYSSAPQSVLMSMRSVLLTILSLWIPLAPLIWLLYRQLSAANSPAKKRKSQNQTANFDDVEGVDAAKLELMEIVSCLQGSTNYQKLGAKLPRGVLLVGPPGTGKTLLARAVAGEAGVPFFSVSASEFVELFVGRGAARIRDLFNTARKSAPSIIFIDELDAVGGRRGRSFNDERDQTLNQLLTELDGFESDMSVIVIAATNRPEALDPALCRPGRFSRKVYVGAPDAIGRQKIASVHLRGVPLEENLDVISNLVASLTQGLVGADIANIVNEAALLAARRGGEVVTREDIMEAIERARFGINEGPVSGGTIRKELERWLSWMPMVTKGANSRDCGPEQPLGYQTLSS